MEHPVVPAAQRGTYLGLAHPAVISYLKGLGVTAVELMPVHQFVTDSHLSEKGLGNYWGYNTIGFFAPHNAYAASGVCGAGAGVQDDGPGPACGRHRGDPRRGLQPHRDRLFAFYDWCAQNDDIPELLSLAKTVSRWENEIVAAVLTGITNAASESLNRLAKLEARLAYGFRNPANQRRRVRIACTRGRRRKSRTATSNRTHAVTEPKSRPGYFEEPNNGGSVCRSARPT